MKLFSDIKIEELDFTKVLINSICLKLKIKTAEMTLFKSFVCFSPEIEKIEFMFSSTTQYHNIVLKKLQIAE